MKNLVKILLTALIVLCLPQLTAYAEETFEEKLLGDVILYEGNNFSYPGIAAELQNGTLTLDCVQYGQDKKGNVQNIMKRFIYSEKETFNTTTLYKGKNHYEAFQVGSFHRKTYCVSNTKDKVKIEVYQNNKLKKSSEISLVPLVDKNKIGKKGYDFQWNEVKVLSKQKVQVLYAVKSGAAKIFYGGVAVFNIGKSKLVSNQTTSFAPVKSDDKYLYGIKKYCYSTGTIPTEKKNLCIANKKGKLLKTYDSDYGMTEDGEYLVSGVPESTTTFCRYSFADGQIMILNQSGIYYGSVDTEGFEQIAQINDLTYYVNNYQKKAMYRIAMQDKMHFAVIYATDYEYPNFTVCRYQKEEI